MEYLPYGLAWVVGLVFAVNVTRYTTWWWHAFPPAGMAVIVVFDPSRPTAESADSLMYTCFALFLTGQMMGFLFEAIRLEVARPKEPLHGRD